MDEKNQTALIAGLSENDALAAKIKLWRLLSKQTERYTTGDSSSVRTETAQELLASICFTLDLYLRESGSPPSLLATADIDDLFALGQKRIAEKIGAYARLYDAACLGAPDIENISLRDTLKSLGKFRQRYDYRLFAHAIPCDIDYQLCRAVPDALLGVLYVNEYLRRLIIENDFLRRFPKDLVIALLRRYCPDYRGQLINLFEPVASNALGLSILGGDARALDITGADRARLSELLAPLPEDRLRAVLAEAAHNLCRALGIQDSAAREYIAQTAQDLYPRIDTALTVGGMGGIFLSLG